MVIEINEKLINIGEHSSIKGILVNDDVGIVRIFVIRRNDPVEVHEVKYKGSTYSSAHYYTGVELDLFLESKEKEALVFGQKEDESEFGYTVRFQFMNHFGFIRYSDKGKVVYIVISGVVIKPDSMGNYYAYGYVPESFEEYIKEIDYAYTNLRYAATTVSHIYYDDYICRVFEFGKNLGEINFKRNSDTKTISYIGHTFEYPRDRDLMVEKLGKRIAKAIFDIA